VLTELRIRNVGVIDDVTLHLRPGLNVLTGETGAGKTMVVSAIEMLLGARADADRVRSGARAALVEASLAPPPPESAEWLDEGDAELIVSREITAADTASSRSRARLGGRMAPVSALSACVGAVVELHGQSDTSRLTAAAVQRDLLDRFGGPSLGAAAQAYSAAYLRWSEARDELTRLQSSTRERAREVDRLRFELDEIDTVAPEVGEEQTLAGDLGRLEHAETLAAAAEQAGAAVMDDGGAHDVLAGADAGLRAAGGLDGQLDELQQRMAAVIAELQDLGLELRRYAAGLESDPARLEVLRQRQADLVRLSRKYSDAAPGGIDTAALLAHAQAARQELVTLDTSDERMAALAHQVTQLDEALRAEAHRLRDERSAAGKRLAQVVEQHLAEMAMAGAHLEVAVDPIDPAPHGADRVTFGLAPGPGESVLPLGKGASGGERSRIALALRLALADADATEVLVFDEVDAGIGGATANAVGRKLAGLAQGRQVICVTHLPQLAAYADAHFCVEKRSDGDRIVAEVNALDDRARIEELSRMLSGSGTELAIGHAEELLETARAAR
jgi:DNA repair protein RecN (Recombination protein N)